MKQLIFIFIFLTTFFGFAPGEEKTDPVKGKPEPVVVTLLVRQVPSAEVGVLVLNDQIFLPVVEIFSHLRIRAQYDSVHNTINGYFITHDSSFSFDIANHLFTIARSQYVLNDSDVYPGKNDLFLRQSRFQTFFKMKFDYFRTMSTVRLKGPRTDLPVYKLRGIQRELEKGPGGVKPIATVERAMSISRLFFEAGALDYNLRYDYTQGIGHKTFFTYRTGMELLWGDLNVFGRAASNRILSKEDYHGTLTYSFPEIQAATQVVIGDLSTGLTQFKPEIFGVEVTNRPPAYPLLFTNEEDYSDNFGPERNVLLSQRGRTMFLGATGTDGVFHQVIPLYYGLNTLRFRAVDYWADEGDKNYLYNIPTTLLRPHTFQYNVFAGRSRLRPSDPFYASGVAQWGVNSDMTIGGEVESYQGLTTDSRELYPTMFLSSRLYRGLLFNAAVSPELQSSATLDLTLPSLARFNIGVIDYRRNAPLNFLNADIQYNAEISLPFYSQDGGVGLFSNYQQVNIPGIIERDFSASVSGSYKMVQPTFTYILGWDDREGDREVTTALSQYGLAAQLPLSVVLQNQLTYDHLGNKFLEYDLFIGKSIGKSFISLSYRNTFSLFTTVTLSMRYLFPFLQSRTLYSASGPTGTFEQEVAGSLLLSTTTRDILFDSHTNRTRSGNLTLDVFEDLNNNGVRDPEERIAPSPLIDIQSEYGLAVQNLRDKTKRDKFDFRNLIPYGDYRLGFRKLDFDNPQLVPTYSTFSVSLRPAQFFRVEIPLVVGGTVRGRVEELVKNTHVPIEGLSVILEPDDSSFTARKQVVKSFSTGEFEITHILPGEYHIRLDRQELTKAGYQMKKMSVPVVLQRKPEGDLIENILFELTE